MHRGWRAWLVLLLLAALGWALPGEGHAEQPEFSEFEVTRTDEGVMLSFALRFDLPRGVEDALSKGVPLYFVAEAEVFRDRWYWRDKRVADLTRTWRIVYQPLTGGYRVTFGALSQTYGTRTEALSAITRGTRWKIADAGQIEDGSHHYLEFRYRLDTNLLPRPMQIGVSGQPDWQLSIMRTLRIN